MTATPAGAGTDLVQPFLIGAGAIRGRVIRLGPAIDRILAGHDYPAPVATLLAETLALAAVLAASLKYDGVFTLQVQAEGAVPLLVADATSEGALRGYARFDADRLAQVQAQGQAQSQGLARDGGSVPRLLGKGYLAFTVDQGADTDRYQGIVELSGNSLADCARGYFEQSEQLQTDVMLAVAPPAGTSGWRAGALMIQRMPLTAQSPILTADLADETWNRACILMGSTRTPELLGPEIDSITLLHRLFHADGLQLLPPKPLVAACRCSASRVEGTLRSFPRSEVEEMRDDGGDIVVVCEFCKSRYVFSDQDLDRLYPA